MKKAGIKDYEAFAKDILQTVTAKPISLEVFSDEFAKWSGRRLKLADWGRTSTSRFPSPTRAASRRSR